MSYQESIYDLLFEKIKLYPPIKMFEAFSGIGTQAMALKNLNVPYQIIGYSEIDKYAIKSYKAIHGDNIKNYGDITKMTFIPQCDIFTWSFPCTDLSKAGRQKGMTKDTRSGLVYDVLRLVKDTKDKPKVLIMENVVDLIQYHFSRQFREIQLELESYGYKNYVETLNSKEYGVAQNRERVFMVSILGDYSYSFPDKIKLEKSLKDYLEKEVDEKYFLNESMIKTFSDMKNRNGYVRGLRFKPHDINNPYAYAITTRAGGRPTDNFIKIKSNNKRLNNIASKIKNNDLQFLDTFNQTTHKEITPTITTRINASNSSFLYKDYKIRKLTPKECWRLMGCSDEDFEKAAKVCSNSQLYKQAGNAIVVDVFEKILRGMVVI